MAAGDSQDARYGPAVAEFGPALERLARAYEAGPDARQAALRRRIHELEALRRE
jgi:hypothetical protein